MARRTTTPIQVISLHTNTGLRLLRTLAEHGEPTPDYLQPTGRPVPPRRVVADRTALEAAAAPKPRRRHGRRRA